MDERGSHGSFSVCMSQLQDGDSTGEVAVYERYVQRLVALARTRLQPRLSSKLDPDDIVQSVFRSFFHRNGAGKIQLSNWDGLWALLAKITVCKCAMQARLMAAAKRDVQLEIPMDGAVSEDCIASGPTPEQAVVLVDLLQVLFEQLTPLQRDVVALKLQQYTNEEISERIERSERTVYRALLRTRDHLSIMAKEITK